MWVENGVRTAVEDVAKAVAAEVARSGNAGGKLEAAWDKLVGALDIGPPPALRACPKCGGEGMLAATRCSTCWTKLTPPHAAATAAQASP